MFERAPDRPGPRGPKDVFRWGRWSVRIDHFFRDVCGGARLPTRNGTEGEKLWMTRKKTWQKRPGPLALIMRAESHGAAMSAPRASRGASSQSDSQPSAAPAGARGSTVTRGAGWKRRLITTIAVIVALIGGAGPAAADDLVSNLAEVSSGIGVILSESNIAMPFTTGTNASGYQLESISINFLTGRSREHEPVYVYVYGDNGNRRPNHRDQIATPTINGATFEGPVAGVNKYTVRKYGRRPAPFNASSVHLDANTQYWVFVWAGESKTLVYVDTTGPQDTGAAGWSIGDSGLVKPRGRPTATTRIGSPH